MSKAFVIKVKENCYWLGGFYGKNNYDDIVHAKVYVNKTQAEKQCKLVNESYGHNAKVVEITIAEGDLEKEIRKQVCNKIREKIDSIVWEDAETVYNEINHFLDQIKQGE